MSKVIERGRTINVQGNRRWVPLKYEKIPCMYFKCGWIIHNFQGCFNSDYQISQTTEVANQFGP